MRKYEMNDGHVYVGTVKEIDYLLTNKKLTIPNFNIVHKFEKVCGLRVNNVNNNDEFHVITLETVLDLLASGVLYYESEEVK